jgi:hypothetical protein
MVQFPDKWITITQPPKSCKNQTKKANQPISFLLETEVEAGFKRSIYIICKMDSFDPLCRPPHKLYADISLYLSFHHPTFLKLNISLGRRE